MRIAISGYYGSRNAGDEAVLGATVHELRRRLPDVEPVVLSADPAGTREEHDVEAAPRWPLSSVRRTIRAADLLLSGGGSLFQDATSSRSLAYYLLTLHAARAAGVPYVIHAQGLGPLSSTPRDSGHCGGGWAGGRPASTWRVRRPSRCATRHRCDWPPSWGCRSNW